MFLNNDRETWLNTLIIGLTEKEKIHTKIVGLKKDRCIPPHGHENEVSVFLTLQGNFHLRQWDRIAVNPTSLDIKPAFDGLVDTGEWNSQSEQRTNVHWLHATSDEAHLLSVRVGKIDGTALGRSRIPIDPDSALDLGTGIFRAPILDQDTWWKRFH
jgi:hypothetical protein